MIRKISGPNTHLQPFSNNNNTNNTNNNTLLRTSFSNTSQNNNSNTNTPSSNNSSSGYISIIDSINEIENETNHGRSFLEEFINDKQHLNSMVTLNYRRKNRKQQPLQQQPSSSPSSNSPSSGGNEKKKSMSFKDKVLNTLSGKKMTTTTNNNSSSSSNSSTTTATSTTPNNTSSAGSNNNNSSGGNNTSSSSLNINDANSDLDNMEETTRKLNISINDTFQLMVVFDFHIFSAQSEENIEIDFTLYSLNEARFISETVAISSDSGRNRICLFRDVTGSYLLKDDIFLIGRAFKKYNITKSSTNNYNSINNSTTTNNNSSNTTSNASLMIDSSNNFVYNYNPTKDDADITHLRRPLAVCAIPFDQDTIRELSNGQSITKSCEFYEKTHEKKFTMLHAVIAAQHAGKRLSVKPTHLLEDDDSTTHNNSSTSNNNSHSDVEKHNTSNSGGGGIRRKSSTNSIPNASTNSASSSASDLANLSTTNSTIGTILLAGQNNHNSSNNTTTTTTTTNPSSSSTTTTLNNSTSTTTTTTPLNSNSSPSSNSTTTTTTGNSALTLLLNELSTTSVQSAPTSLYSYKSIGTECKQLKDQLNVNFVFYKGDYDIVMSDQPQFQRLTTSKPINWFSINTKNEIRTNYSFLENRCDIYPSMDRATFSMIKSKNPLVIIRLFEVKNSQTKEGRFIPLYRNNENDPIKIRSGKLMDYIDGPYHYASYLFCKKTNPKFFEPFHIDASNVENFENLYLYLYVYNINNIKGNRYEIEDEPALLGFYKFTDSESIMNFEKLKLIELYKPQKNSSNTLYNSLSSRANILSILPELKKSKPEKNNIKMSFTFFISSIPHNNYLQIFFLWKQFIIKNISILELIEIVKKKITYKECVLHANGLFISLFSILEFYFDDQNIRLKTLESLFYFIGQYFKNSELLFEQIIYKIPINEKVYQSVLIYLNDRLQESLNTLSIISSNNNNNTNSSSNNSTVVAVNSSSKTSTANNNNNTNHEVHYKNIYHAIQSFSLVMIMLKKKNNSQQDKKKQTKQTREIIEFKEQFNSLVSKLLLILNLNANNLPNVAIVKGNLMKSLTVSVFDILFEILTNEEFEVFLKSLFEIEISQTEKFNVYSNILKSKCFCQTLTTTTLNLINSILLKITIPLIRENIQKDYKNYIPLLIQIGRLFENTIISNVMHLNGGTTSAGSSAGSVSGSSSELNPIIVNLFKQLCQFGPILLNADIQLMGDCKKYLKEMETKPKSEQLYSNSMELRKKIYSFYYLIIYWSCNNSNLFNEMIKSSEKLQKDDSSNSSTTTSGSTGAGDIINTILSMINSTLNGEFDKLQCINPLVSEIEMFRPFHKKRVLDIFEFLKTIKKFNFNSNIYLECLCLASFSTILDTDTKITIFEYMVKYLEEISSTIDYNKFVNIYFLPMSVSSISSNINSSNNNNNGNNNSTNNSGGSENHHLFYNRWTNFINEKLFSNSNLLPKLKNSIQPNIDDYFKQIFEKSNLELIYNYFIKPLSENSEMLNLIKIYNIIKKQASISNDGNQIKKTKKNVLINRYEVLKKIGFGGFGSVFKVCDLQSEDKKILALKILPREEGNNVEFIQMSKLNHDNILPVYEIFETNIGNFEKWCFTMPFIEMGDFQSYLLNLKSNLPIHRILNYMKQMLSSIEYIHQRQVYHRDIKPENFLLKSQDHVVLSDFGLAKGDVCESVITKTSIVGTELFQSPELFAGEVKDVSKTDIYGLGCVFYILITRDFQTTVRISILNGGKEIRERLTLALMESLNNGGGAPLNSSNSGSSQNLLSSTNSTTTTTNNTLVINGNTIDVNAIIDFVMIMLDKDYARRPSAEMARSLWLETKIGYNKS